MKILEFGFKNICSYGNKQQSFVLPEEAQLIHVHGVNGGGKSSISDALTISIYGKSSVRKMKDIPNRINKNAYTYCKFKSANGKIIEIERGIDPNFTNLIIDKEPYILPDKRKMDEYVEEELAKMPFAVFSNTISLSVNDFKSFVELSPSDKRKIIDKIFAVDIYSTLGEFVKVDYKAKKQEIVIVDSNITNTSLILDRTRTQLASIEADLLIETTEKLKELNIALSSAKTEMENLRTAGLTLKGNIDTAKENYRTKFNRLTELRSDISQIKEKLKLFAENTCPHCLSSLTDDFHKTIKNELEEKAKNIATEGSALAKEVSTIENDIRTLESDFSNSNILLNKKNVLVNTISQQIRDLEAKKTSNDTVESIKTTISDLENSIDDYQDSKKVLNEELSVFSEMEKVLSDNGIKSIVMSQIIPILNEKVVLLSKELEFKFQFEFDSEFTPIVRHLGQEISVMSLSSGERKKMNLIVLLCIIELLKMKHHSVNLMFLDEVFTSLDTDSIYRVLKILRDFVNTHKMKVFVISHDPLPEELFDVKLQVNNNQHFSDISII